MFDFFFPLIALFIFAYLCNSSESIESLLLDMGLKGLQHLVTDDVVLAPVFCSGHGLENAALSERIVQAEATVRDYRNESSLGILFDAWEVY